MLTVDWDGAVVTFVVYDATVHLRQHDVDRHVEWCLGATVAHRLWVQLTVIAVIMSRRSTSKHLDSDIAGNTEPEMPR